MNNYELIRKAIETKSQVFAIYNGKHRGLCPHVIGTKRGREQALCFQFEGSSTSGLPDGGQWRCLPIEGLENIELREGEWHTGSHGAMPQSCVDEIDLTVSY